MRNITLDIPERARRVRARARRELAYSLVRENRGDFNAPPRRAVYREAEG